MGCMVPGQSVKEQSLASVKEGCTLDGCCCHHCSSGHSASLAGCSLGMHVHRQPCQMFSRKAVSEGSKKHKYFVTFLGSFSEPGIPRGQHCIELRTFRLHPPAHLYSHPVWLSGAWWADRSRTFSESCSYFYQRTISNARRPQRSQAM